MRFSWKDLRYQIADKLFCAELDEAYSMGIRVGSEFTARKMSFRLRNRPTMTKTQTQGYDLAFDAIQEVKKEISQQTGAML